MSPGGHKFDPARRGQLDDPERRTYLDPNRILRAFRVEPGMRVADIGAGTGFFAVPAADRVGPGGRVYAIDLAPEMIDALKVKVAAAGKTEVEVVPSTEDRIPLPARSVDFVLLACVLHELDGIATLLECGRILRPTGRVGVVDWRKIEQDIGPPREHRLNERQAEGALRRGGFTPKRVFPAGPHHYGIEAEPNAP